MHRRDSVHIYFGASFLLILFVLLGVTLGAHTLSPDHSEHILSHISHPDDPDDPDGNYLPTGDFCAVSVIATTSFDTPVAVDLPEVYFAYAEDRGAMSETPVMRRAYTHFSLRAPPESL